MSRTKESVVDGVCSRGTVLLPQQRVQACRGIKGLAITSCSSRATYKATRDLSMGQISRIIRISYLVRFSKSRCFRRASIDFSQVDP